LFKHAMRLFSTLQGVSRIIVTSRVFRTTLCKQIAFG